MSGNPYSCINYLNCFHKSSVQSVFYLSPPAIAPGTSLKSISLQKQKRYKLSISLSFVDNIKTLPFDQKLPENHLTENDVSYSILSKLLLSGFL